MAGLLDFLQTPAGTGLLSAVAGGMAGARRGTPWNNMGRAGIAGVTGYAQAQDDILKKQQLDEAQKMNVLQRQQYERQMAQQDTQNKFFSPENMGKFIKQPTPETTSFANPLFTQEAAGMKPDYSTKTTPATPGGFDLSAYTQAMLGSGDPTIAQKGLELISKEKEKPQLVSVQTPNGPIQRWVRPGETAGVDVGAPVDKESALPWYVKKGDKGLAIDPAYAEFEHMKAANMRAPAQPMAPVAYMNDKGQTVWGTITDARGRPAANYSPTLQGQLAQAKEVGKVTGEEQTKAGFDAPRIIDTGESAINMSNQLLTHPGFSSTVGATLMPGARFVEGTPQADFMVRLEQLKGGAFLEAYNTLKGGGQITEVEGKKATTAIARMEKSQSEGEFKAAVKDYQDVIRKGVNRAKMKAKPVGPVQPQAQGGAKFLGFE